ncbi:MAG: tRNA (N6-threonylcarbamoyladenosine(37)-N6)-methyltransferase TrmO [Polyangiaceae bacterium]
MTSGRSKPDEKPSLKGFSTLTLTPIGVVRSPFIEKISAPRQASLARGVKGRIELVSGLDLEHAVEDLAAWDHIWVLFWFHLNTGWKPKVLPPRSQTKRGVLSTRSPHRPNPIGMSVVRLEAVDGLVLSIADLDILDGTPVLDVKPYVPYADSIPSAGMGWLDEDEAALGDATLDTKLVASSSHPFEAKQKATDPNPDFEVRWEERAAAQARYLRVEHGIDIESPINAALSLGPAPHPYRRIKRDKDKLVLASKAWRARFRVEGRVVHVEDIATGYRARELTPSVADANEPSELLVHRAFLARFEETNEQ